jgi:hypothetical protein
MPSADHANRRLLRLIRLVEQGDRRATKGVLVTKKRVSVRCPKRPGLALAMRIRAVVPYATADAELVAPLAPAPGNDARTRLRAQLATSLVDVTNAPGQPPCASMTSSTSAISWIVSEIAETILW